MAWLLVSLLILTFILLGAGFCFGGENGLIIARIVCGFLWRKGCSEHNEKEAERRREQIELLRLEEQKRERQAAEECQRQAAQLAREQEKARRERAFLDFARTEMAQALQAHANMVAEIREQEKRLARLRQVLIDLDKSVMWNKEHRVQKSKLNDMCELKDDLWECIEMTYIETVKCETFKGDSAASARMRAIDEGRNKAESIVRRFDTISRRE